MSISFKANFEMTKDYKKQYPLMATCESRIQKEFNEMTKDETFYTLQLNYDKRNQDEVFILSKKGADSKNQKTVLDFQDNFKRQSSLFVKTVFDYLIERPRKEEKENDIEQTYAIDCNKLKKDYHNSIDKLRADYEKNMSELNKNADRNSSQIENDYTTNRSTLWKTLHNWGNN